MKQSKTAIWYSSSVVDFLSAVNLGFTQKLQ